MGSVQSKDESQAVSPAAKNAEVILRQTLTSSSFVNDTAGLLLLSAQAPLLIQLIAVLSSTAPDPSLVNKNMTEKQFLNLHHPESFKASISQVASDIARAYQKADHSMNTIKSLLMDLPDYFISVLEILNQPHDDPKSQRSLQTFRLKIEEASKKCKEKAAISEAEFSIVMATIEELCHAAVVSNTTNARQLNENKIREEILVIDRDAKAAADITFGSEKKIADERRNRAEQVYMEGMKNDQTYLKVIGAVAVQAACKVGEAAGKAAVDVYKMQKNKENCSNPESPNLDECVNTAKIGIDLVNESLKKLQINEIDKVNYAVHANLMQKLQTIATSLGYPMDQQTVSNHILTLKDYEKKKYGTTEGVVLLGKAAELRHFLELNGQNLENANVKIAAQEIKASIENAVGDCMNSIEERRKQQSIERTAKMSLQEKIIKAESDKLRNASEQYSQERVIAEKIRNDKNKNAEELREIIRELRQIDLTSTDLTGYIQYLKNALRYLSKIKTSWSYLVAFFDNIQIVIDNNLASNALLFTQQMKEESLESLKIRSALKATAYCIQITQCAEIYTATSYKFIKPVISTIDGLFSLELNEAKQKQNEIQNKLCVVEEDVQQVIDEYLADYDGLVNQQIETFAADLTNSVQFNNGLNSLE